MLGGANTRAADALAVGIDRWASGRCGILFEWTRDLQTKRSDITIYQSRTLTDLPNAGKVFAYRKDNVEPALHLQPSAIAFERYYYSQPLPEGGRDNNTFENFFGTIESTWNPLAVRLCSTAAANFTSSEFVDLFTFLILMRVRVPAARDMIEVTLAEQVKATTRLLDQQGKLPPKPEGLSRVPTAGPQMTESR